MSFSAYTFLNRIKGLRPTTAGMAALQQFLNTQFQAIATSLASVPVISAFAETLLDDTTAANARATLGLGSISTQNSNLVTITGGTITGITDLAIADGGTGASTSADARTNLGVAIGSDVQAYNSNLNTYVATPLDTAELGQLQNIGTTTISAAQWGYVGGADQAVKTTDSPSFAGLAVDTDVLYVDATNDRVGINDASPTYELDIGPDAAGGNSVVNINSAASSASRLYFSQNGTLKWNIGSNSTNNNFTFYDGTTNPVVFEAGASANTLVVDSNSRIGIGTASPTGPLDVTGDVIRLRSSKTPSSATADGNAGDICWDSNYIYICVAASTWKRVAISTWT